MTTDAPPPAEKDKPKPAVEPAVEQPPAPLQAEADQTRRTADGAPVVKVADKPPATQTELQIVDPAKVRRLNDESITKLAKEMHDAVHKEGWFGRDTPDAEKILRNLEGLNPADRKALEAAYDGNEPGKFRREMKDKLDAVEFRKAEAMLNRTGDRTNDAGAVMVALTRIKDGDEERGNRELREVLQAMTPEQIADMKRDFAKNYPEFGNKSFEQIVRATDGIEKETADGLELMMKGVPGLKGEGRTSEDMQKLAKLALDAGNLEMLGQVINGDTPAAKAAREALKANPDFMKKFKDEWGNNRVANDYLNEGRVSLATIASGNAPKFWFDNPKNTTLALDGATEKERADFKRGRELALGLAGPSDNAAEDKRVREYYDKIHKAFKDSGGGSNDNERDRQVAIWEDHLLHPKGSLVSQMADTHGNQWGVFGLGLHVGGGHEKQDLFSKVESLSEQDWKALSAEYKANPNGGGPFMREIRESLEKYTDKGERERILKMLADKAQAPDYEASKKVGRRGLVETIEDNRNSFLGITTSFNGKNIAEGITNMTEAEAKAYRDNTNGVRDTLDKFMKENMNEAERTYAQRQLERRTGTTPEERNNPANQQAAQERLVAGTGDEKSRLRDVETVLANKELREKLSKGEGLTEPEKKLKTIIESEAAVDRILKSKVDGGSATGRLQDIEAALANPQMRERLNKPDDQLSSTDRQLKKILESTVTDAYMASGNYYPGGGGMEGGGAYDPQAQERMDRAIKDATAALLKDGKIPPDQKLELGFKANQVYADLPNATKEQQTAALAKMNEQERMIADQVIKNKGMQPVDKLRSFILGDGTSKEQIQDYLKGLQKEGKLGPGGIGEIYEQYNARYGTKSNGQRNTGTFFDDFNAKFSKEEQLQFRNLLSRELLDGRQEANDAYSIAQQNQGGADFDASRLTMERHNQAFRDALQEFQGKIPPEKMDELTKGFAEAVKQYKESKEKAAEIITNAIIMAVAIAATIASGGAASPLLVLALGGVGAITKLAGTALLEGGSFEKTLSNAIKLAVEGALTGALSAAGPETFVLMGQTSRVAIPLASKGLMTFFKEAGVAGVLKEGTEALVTKEMRAALAEAASYGRPLAKDALERIAAKAIPKDEIIMIGGKQVSARAAFTDVLQQQLASETKLVLQASGEQTFRQAFVSTVVREGGFNAVIGEAGNAASTPFINLVNGKGFNMEGYGLGWQALLPVGFAPGMRIGVRAAVHMARPVAEAMQASARQWDRLVHPNAFEFNPTAFHIQHPEMNARIIDSATGKEIWRSGQIEPVRFDADKMKIVDASGKELEGPMPFLRKTDTVNSAGSVIPAERTGDPPIKVLKNENGVIEAQVGNSLVRIENNVPTSVKMDGLEVTQVRTRDGGALVDTVKMKDASGQMVEYKLDLQTGKYVDAKGVHADFDSVEVNLVNGSVTVKYPPGSTVEARVTHLNGAVDEWQHAGTIQRTAADGTRSEIGKWEPAGEPVRVASLDNATDVPVTRPSAALDAPAQEVKLGENLGVTQRTTADGGTVVESVRFKDESGTVVQYKLDEASGKYVDGQNRPAAFSSVQVDPARGTVTFRYDADSPIASRVQHASGDAYVLKTDGTMQRISADGKVTEIPENLQTTIRNITNTPEAALPSAKRAELVESTLAAYKRETETLPGQYRAELQAKQAELGLSNADVDLRVKQAEEYYQRNFARTQKDIDTALAGASAAGGDVRRAITTSFEDGAARADRAAALRKDLLDVKVTRDGGGLTDVWAKFEADPKLSQEQKDRLFNVLAESRHYYTDTVPKTVEADLRAKASRGELDLNTPIKDADIRAKLERGDITPAEARIQDGTLAARQYQEVNWKHTRGEIDQVLESTRMRPNMTPNQVEDAVLGSIFSDMVKNPANFIVHNIDGAKAAAEILPRHLDMSIPANRARVDGIVQAIKEHQIGPPKFMSDMNEMFVGFSVKAQLAENIKALTKVNGGALSDADAAVVAGLEKRLTANWGGGQPARAPLTDSELAFLKNAGRANNPADPDKLVRDFNEYIENINEVKRKISNPMEGMPGHRPGDLTADGSQINFTDAEKRLLARIGVNEWTVPNPNSPHYLASRSIIDGDSLINYATPDGWAKIAAIRGPDTPFAFDRTVFDSLASAKTSYNDAFTVMSDEARTLGKRGLELTEEAVQRVKSSVNVDGVAADGMDGWLQRTITQRGDQIGYGDKVKQRIWDTPEFQRQLADVEASARAKGLPEAEIDLAKQKLRDSVGKVSFWDPDAIPLSQLKQFGFSDAEIAARMQLAREIRSNMVERLRSEQTNWANREDFTPPPRVVAPGTPSPGGTQTQLNRPAALGTGFYRDAAVKPGTTVNSTQPVAGSRTDARTRLGEELTEDAANSGGGSQIGPGGNATTQSQTQTGTPGHQAPKSNDDMGNNTGGTVQRQANTDPNAALNAAGAPTARAVDPQAGAQSPGSRGPVTRDQAELPRGGEVTLKAENDNAGRAKVYEATLTARDGSTDAVVFHLPEGDEPVAPRLTQERAAAGLNREIGFENTYPRSTEHSLDVNGQRVDGWIQEHGGNPIGDELRERVGQRFGRVDRVEEDLPALLREDAQLREELSNIVAERIVYGDRDISIHNIVRDADGRLHNIDAGHAFEEGAADSIHFRTTDLENIGLARALENQPLPEGVRNKLRDFAARYSDDASVERLASDLGVPVEQVKGSVARARALAESGHFPPADAKLVSADNIEFARAVRHSDEKAARRTGDVFRDGNAVELSGEQVPRADFNQPMRVTANDEVRVGKNSRGQSVEYDAGSYRRVQIQGKEYELVRAGGSPDSPDGDGFYYPRDPRSGYIRFNGDNGAVKVHVGGTSGQELDRLQKVLIPALETDDFLRSHVVTWKTLDPQFAVNPAAANGMGPAVHGQQAKAFTIYAANAEEARSIARYIDERYLKQHPELISGKPINGGNVDIVLANGSNRVGLVRDAFQPAPGIELRTREQWAAFKADPRIKVDEAINAKVLADNDLARFKIQGQDGRYRLNEPGLRALEAKSGLRPNTLYYDNNGNLILKASPGSGSSQPAGVYVTESGAGKQFGDLSDRPAMYALTNHYKIADPADLADFHLAPGRVYNEADLRKLEGFMDVQPGSLRYDNHGNLVFRERVAAPQQAVDVPPALQRGNHVQFQGENFVVAGFDRNTGGMVLQRQQGRDLIVPRERFGEIAPLERIATTTPAPKVEVNLEGDSMLREYVVDGEKHLLGRRGNQIWFYGGRGTDSGHPIKLHVTTDSPADVGRIQAVLIKELKDKNGDLYKMVSDWKTFDPQWGVNPAKAAGLKHPPTGIGNGGKGFTIYVEDPAHLVAIQKKIDDLLADAGLSLPRPHGTGNVDKVSGRSNRVGVVRESFDIAQSTDGRIGARIDQRVHEQMLAEHNLTPGSRLTDSQLRNLEDRLGIQRDTLTYSKDGDLMLSRSSRDSSVNQDGKSIYMDESQAGKGVEVNGRPRTDRSAIYELYKHYGEDPVDLFLKPRIAAGAGAADTQPARVMAFGGKADIQPNRSYIVGRTNGQAADIPINDPHVSARHALLRTDEYGNFIIKDLVSTNGTYVNGQRLQGEYALRKGDVVTVGNPPLHTIEWENSYRAQHSVRVGNAELHLQVGDERLIGRNNYPGNNMVSSRHAVVGLDEKGIYLRDPGSTNGTYIVRDGQQIKLTAAGAFDMKTGVQLGGPGEAFHLKSTDEVWLAGEPWTGGERLSLSAIEAAKPSAAFRVDAPPSDAARAQSNNFARRHEVREPLQDGFHFAGTDREIDQLGRPKWGTVPVTVVDKAELAPIIADARARFAHLPPDQRAIALAHYVRDKFVPPGMRSENLTDWYVDFLDAHGSQRLTLGRFLQEGKGSCVQQALLFKALGDELGLPVTLIRGNGTNGGTTFNHVWTTVDFGQGPRVFDPRQQLYDFPADRLPSHVPASDIIARYGPQPGALYQSGDRVLWAGRNSWVVDGFDPRTGDVMIHHFGTRPIELSELPDFNNLNRAKLQREGSLRIGEQYQMRRSSGAVETWRLDGINQDGSLRMSSDTAFHEVLPKAALASGHGPELAGGSDWLPLPGEAPDVARRRIMRTIEENRGLIDAANGKEERSQLYVHKQMETVLEDLKARGEIDPEWRVIASANKSPADSVGWDFMLVNERTGAMHPLDITANPEKYESPYKHNVPTLRQSGLIYYNKGWFDIAGYLDVDHPALGAAAKEFPAELRAHLKGLTETHTPFVLGETPMPDLRVSPAIDGQAEVEGFTKWLREKAEQYPDGQLRSDMLEYADQLDAKAGRYLSIQARTEYSLDLRSQAADVGERAVLEAIIEKLARKQAVVTPVPVGRAPHETADVYVHKNGIIVLQGTDGKVYEAGHVATALDTGRRSLLTSGRVKELIPDKRMKKLIAEMRLTDTPRQSAEEQLLGAIQSELYAANNAIGAMPNQSSINVKDPMIQQLVGRLKNRSEDRLLGREIVVPPSVKPASASVRAGADTTASAKVEHPEIYSEIKTYWEELGQNASELNGRPVENMVTTLEMILEDKKGVWSADQITHLTELLDSYKAGDPRAVNAVHALLK